MGSSTVYTSTRIFVRNFRINMVATTHSYNDWTSSTLFLCENNKQFGFTLVSMRCNNTTLWYKLEKQNKLKRNDQCKKVKGKKGKKKKERK